MPETPPELARLHTEGARAELADLDTRSIRELVETINAEDATVAPAVADAAEQVAKAVEVIVERLRRGGRLVYAGAGTPGRLGVVDAAECAPTFGVEPGAVLGLMAGGAAAFTAAVEDAEDDRQAAAADVTAAEVGSDDVLVGISASGRTPYALAAVEAAAAVGCATVGLSNNPDSALGSLVDVAIEVDTGPEVIAGSTRMKAGTAQKLVLNTLSTAAMVRLGKTYGNLMVDVRAANEKLRVRASHIVATATGADTESCARSLELAGGHVKTAVVMLLADLTAEEARDRLAAASGRAREAVAATTGTPARGTPARETPSPGGGS